MELPSFYSTFLRKFLRHSKSGKPITEEQANPVTAAISRRMGLVFLLSSVAPLASAQVYPLNQLKQDIASFLATEYQQVEHARIDINVGNLDNRLRLANCDQPPAFTSQDPTGLGGNISVKAQCSGSQPWSVHVPAQVTIYRDIPVAIRDIARGEVISQAHMTSSQVNVSGIRQEFLSEASAIFDKEAKRNISKGEPFRTAMLDAPTVVKRGEIVMLESLAGSIKVSSAGTAMVDGRIGQKIRVRNNSSERIISGIVVSQGIVQTL